MVSWRDASVVAVPRPWVRHSSVTLLLPMFRVTVLWRPMAHWVVIWANETVNFGSASEGYWMKKVNDKPIYTIRAANAALIVYKCMCHFAP